jgi:hypothetical protein
MVDLSVLHILRSPNLHMKNESTHLHALSKPPFSFMIRGTIKLYFQTIIREENLA